MKVFQSVLLFFGLILFASCGKELSVENDADSGTATYTLGAGAADICSGAVINGTFKEGVATDATNTVSFSVDVTAPGTYSINIPAVNGVSFSGSGNFTAAGAQTVTLAASGTPTAAGIFDYSPGGNNNGCTFSVEVIPAGPPAVFTLSGAPNACLTPVINGTYQATVPLNSSNTVEIKVDVTTAGSYNITTSTENGMSFSASGNFTTTGNGQVVTLRGSGTPDTAGTVSLTPEFGGSACSFDVTVATAPPVAPGVLTCKIDGVFTSFYDRAEAQTIDGLGMQYLYLTGYTDVPNGSNVPQLQLFVTKNDKSAVTTGTYNVDGYLSLTGYRIEVDYHVVNADQSVTIWNTSSTILNPPNPPFEIKVTTLTATRAKGTFSGKIQEAGGGNSTLKTVSEGVFDLPINN